MYLTNIVSLTLAMGSLFFGISDSCSDTLLTKLPATYIENGGHCHINTWCGVTEMPMGDGNTYTEFLLVHSPATVDFALDGQYESLTGVVGMAGKCNCCQNPSPCFAISFSVTIKVDGVQAYKSRVFTSIDQYENIDIDVSGAQTVRVESDIEGRYECDHATIALPMLTCGRQRPSRTTKEPMCCANSGGQKKARQETRMDNKCSRARSESKCLATSDKRGNTPCKYVPCAVVYEDEDGEYWLVDDDNIFMAYGHQLMYDMRNGDIWVYGVVFIICFCMFIAWMNRRRFSEYKQLPESIENKPLLSNTKV